MKESEFQFANPSLHRINFSENSQFRRDESNEIKMSTKLQASHEKNADNEAVVSLIVRVGSLEENVPFVLEAEFISNFHWNKELPEDRVGIFLEQNAPALLLSYARPIIAMITNSSHFPAYNIPFFNFLKDN